MTILIISILILICVKQRNFASAKTIQAIRLKKNGAKFLKYPIHKIYKIEDIELLWQVLKHSIMVNDYGICLKLLTER